VAAGVARNKGVNRAVTSKQRGVDCDTSPRKQGPTE
jgi:hypothetical protein